MAKKLNDWIETDVRPHRDKSIAWISQHHFFRDPMRPTYSDLRYFFSPADGIILYQREVRPDECIVEIKGRAYSLRDALRDPHYEAPSLVIVPSLEAQGARVRAYDPHGMAEARKLMPQLETTSDPYACIEGADAMLILTEWDQFRALDLDRVKKTLRSPVVIDLRNIYRPAELAAKGLNYISVGRG